MKNKKLSMHDRIYNKNITWDNLLEKIDEEMERLYNLSYEVENSKMDSAVKAVYLEQIEQRIVTLHMAANSGCVDKKKQQDAEPTMEL